jgi:precorrin-2 dehydrogenase/sirohydrochlorin ferrochelatase
MRYYPINLDIQNRRCLVIGGGGVATRKVKTLIACGARVTVVSPKTTDALNTLAGTNAVTLIRRSYASADLDGMFLVIGATDDRSLNRQIYEDAEKAGRLCNIADQPELCNFILPSIVHRGDLILAISTSGTSPAFAKKLRQELEKAYGNEYALFLQLMGAIRRKLLSRAHEPEAHKAVFEQLIEKGLLEKMAADDREGIDAILYQVLGEGFDFDELMR